MKYKEGRNGARRYMAEELYVENTGYPYLTSCSGDLTFQSTNLLNDHSISQFRRNCYFFRLNFVFLFIFREYYYFTVSTPDTPPLPAWDPIC